jgi:alkylation response protein AidB-like acyl-CoA dehydrogenase
MLIRVEAARAATSYALWCADHDPEALPLAAATAKATASEGATWVATETIHVHGGVGFTWEHPAHLYYRRALSSMVLFGHPDAHDRALGTALIDRTRASG